MKILIVSDNHRQLGNFYKVMEKVGPVDLVIHCGDAEVSEPTLAQVAQCPLEIVSGNNDYFSHAMNEREFELGPYKVWLVHGHRHRVTVEEDTIRREASRRGMDILMYGHTHRPVIDIAPGLTALNPGSLSYPRQDGRRPSYIIMDIDREGAAHYTINYL